MIDDPRLSTDSLLVAYRDAIGPSPSAQERVLARLRQQLDAGSHVVSNPVAARPQTARWGWLFGSVLAAGAAAALVFLVVAPRPSVTGVTGERSSSTAVVAQASKHRPVDGTVRGALPPSSLVPEEAERIDGPNPAISPSVHSVVQSQESVLDEAKLVDQRSRRQLPSDTKGLLSVAPAAQPRESSPTDAVGGAAPFIAGSSETPRQSGLAGAAIVTGRPAASAPIEASIRHPERTSYARPDLRCRARFDNCSQSAALWVLENKCRDDYATCVAEREQISLDEAFDYLELTCELDTLACLLAETSSPEACGRRIAPLCMANDARDDQAIQLAKRCVARLHLCMQEDRHEAASCASDFSVCFSERAGPN